VPLPIPASELAVRDYSEAYGTIRNISEVKDPKTDEIISIDIEWWNGEKHTGISPEAMYDIIQGGLTDREPNQSVREGLAEDHPDK
jgi:hypothetical protein